MFNKKLEKETKVANLHTEDIINQLIKYNIFDKFTSREELEEWISKLNSFKINNILSLKIELEDIKFNSKLLINNNLLNTIDYIKKVEALVSINNADGYYQLFDRMLHPEFLNSQKFYQDIETLKRAYSAQTPLWIIGETTFINSPYHDEDFELLVTAKDTCDKDFPYIVCEAIATIAENEDSIYSDYHRQDLQTIIKYGSKSLQFVNSFPEGSINNLAVNSVSLKDKYHLENMEILANNKEIGNFLYAVMTNEDVIGRRDYRIIIKEMLDHKDNINYVFLVCYYAVGEEAAKKAQNLLLHDYFYEISWKYNIDELIQQVAERIKKIIESIDIIDGEFKEINTYEVEDKSITKKKNILKKVFKK